MFADFHRQDLIARERIQRLHQEASLARLLKEARSERVRRTFWNFLRPRTLRPVSA